MKPTNTRPDLLLPDNAPVSCSFMARADAPIFWERCETNATEKIDPGERTRFDQYLAEHPKSIIMLYPGPTYLCGTHAEIMRECL